MEIVTDRLVLRRFSDDDAPFVLALTREPAFIRFIGDRGLQDEAQARAYITAGPIASYRDRGYGGYVVEDRQGTALGMCGMLKRDTLPEPDLGFAFLRAHRGQGYATEAARAVLAHEHRVHGIDRALAIVTPDNARSLALLERLGFVPTGLQFPGTEDGVVLRVLAWRAPDAG